MTETISDTIPYGRLMHRAMRSLIQTVLEGVSNSGLPGQHHFFITFNTQHPDVNIAQWLMDRYPEEMTIVVQHWFDGLEVDDDGFAITLNFGENPEPMRVPFDAILTFVDPSVEFGLRFETHSEEDGPDDGAPEPDDLPTPDEVSNEAPKEAQVVRLDAFRKGH
jgi:hypothetical protein